MMDIDWSKAPEGATHYDVAESRISSFMRLENGSWFFWPPSSSNPVWTFWRPDTVDVEEMIPRPSITDWNGGGLPPVGTVCEVQHHSWADTIWERRTVRYLSDQHIVTVEVDGQERVCHPDALKFRPIRTPEQIAAEIECVTIKEICGDLDVPIAIARKAYEKGYRKQVSP